MLTAAHLVGHRRSQYAIDWLRPVDITRRLTAAGYPKPPGGD